LLRRDDQAMNVNVVGSAKEINDIRENPRGAQ
jgi:hypothetical protein